MRLTRRFFYVLGSAMCLALLPSAPVNAQPEQQAVDPQTMAWLDCIHKKMPIYRKRHRDTPEAADATLHACRGEFDQIKNNPQAGVTDDSRAELKRQIPALTMLYLSQMPRPSSPSRKSLGNEL